MGASVLALTVAMAPAQAILLFDNGALLPDSGSISDLAGASESSNPFQLTTSSDIKTIAWSGSYGLSPAIQDTFAVRLFSASNGAIELTPLATLSGSISRTATVKNSLNWQLYDYVLTLGSPYRISPDRYWLSIVNNTANAPQSVWTWSASNALVDLAGRPNAIEPWTLLAPDNGVVTTGLAFKIEGDPVAIPTPALLPGLIGMGLGIWRRRKAMI